MRGTGARNCDQFKSADDPKKEVCMDIKLNLLESFEARGSDGRTYKVMGYERLARDESVPNAVERWEPTGTSEYRLAEGGLVDAYGDGSMRIHHSGVTLQRT
jgi:hypothetical protein